MAQLHIHGLSDSNILSGVVTVSGAKNSALPIIASSLLVDTPVTLTNVPHLTDTTTMLELLGSLGAMISFSEKSILKICTDQVNNFVAPYNLVKKMRASFLVLGPLLARYGQASVSLPGGCAIGARPVFEHLRGLEKLGAEVRVENGYVIAKSGAKGLVGNKICMEKVSVTGTENLLMAAVLANGSTEIINAAREPEVSDLAVFLNNMGAKIEGIGTDRLYVEGVSRLVAVDQVHSIMPDRIEAGTFLIAAALARGSVSIKNVDHKHLSVVLEKLRAAGALIQIEDDTIALDMQGQRPKAVSIQTAVYPGFPTDLQAQWAAMNALAEGSATVCETIFDNRLMHIPELQRMGADIRINGGTLFIQGKEKLNGANVMATDLRASACLVLAAIRAEGKTVIDRVYHIDRGYECIEDKFSCLGVDIKRYPLKKHGGVYEKYFDSEDS